MSKSSKYSEETSDTDENDDIVYTHPIVTEKKGYMDLTDYERNYQDMETRAKMQHVKSPIEEESMKPKVHDDRSKKTILEVPKSSTNENAKKRYTEDPKATTSKVTEKNKNGKIDTLINTTKEHGNASMGSPQKINDSEDNANMSELTDISPEEAYVRHMERVIAANALPPQNMEILKNLYTRYNSNKKHASTIEETRVETGIDTSNLGESKSDTRDQIENAPIHDGEKLILNSSLEEPNDVIQSSTQEVSKTSIVTESSVMDDKKIVSLESTDLFANNDEILTSTPKTSKENILSPSNLNDIKDVICDVTNMTIESPFSDFSLQTVKLKSGLKDLEVIKEEDGIITKKHDNKDSSVIKEEINLTSINQNQRSSSSVSSSSEYPASMDASNNVQLSDPKNILENDNKLFITEDDLACRCPQIEASAISNESNNVESIPERIRRYFLSLLIDYLVPRQVRSSKSKVPCM